MTTHRSTKNASRDISAIDLQAGLDTINTLKAQLQSALTDLGNVDRRGKARLGLHSTEFASTTLGYAQANPQLTPVFLDVDTFSTNSAKVAALRVLRQPLSQLLDQIDDTMLVVGGEVMAAALAWYNAVQSASKLKVPGAATIADDLHKRFKRVSRSVKTPPASGTTSGTGTGTGKDSGVDPAPAPAPAVA